MLYNEKKWKEYNYMQNNTELKNWDTKFLYFILPVIESSKGIITNLQCYNVE